MKFSKLVCRECSTVFKQICQTSLSRAPRFIGRVIRDIVSLLKQVCYEMPTTVVKHKFFTKLRTFKEIKFVTEKVCVKLFIKISCNTSKYHTKFTRIRYCKLQLKIQVNTPPSTIVARFENYSFEKDALSFTCWSRVIQTLHTLRRIGHEP